MKEIVKNLALLLTDHKAENTIVLHVGEQCNYTDYFIIATARSSRHLHSLAEKAKEHLEIQNIQMLYQSDSRDDSGWLLLDCGFFVVHLMDVEKRAFYELEKLMFQSPVIDYSSNSS